MSTRNLRDFQAEETTGRDRTEQALRESEARLRLSVQGGNVGLWDWDLQTDAVYYSPEWKMQIGYRDDEISNRFEEWQSRVHPEDLDPVLHKIAVFLENPQSPHEVEFRLRHKDGSYRWIYARGDLFRDDSGKAVRMLGCHIDITHRKCAEEAVRESEERFRAIFELAAVGVAQVAPNGAWRGVNQRFCDIVGYTREELLGLTFQDITHPDDLDADLGFVRQMLAGEIGTYAMEKRYIRKGGGIVWINLTVSLVREASGAPKYFVSVVENITERKLTERALRESEECYRQLFDANPHPMWAYALGTLRFLAVNAAAIAHYGYSREEFLAMTIKDIRPPEDVPALLADVATVTEGLSKMWIWRHRKRDGTIIKVETRSHVLEFEGVRAEVVLAHDITERLRLEACLLQAEDAERRRIAKELHDSTAQDLVAVTMDLGMLHESLTPGNPKAARVLEDSIALVENCVNDIRTLSYVLHPPRLDETGLVGALAEYAAGFTTRSDTRIRAEIAPDFGRLPEEVEIVFFRVAQEAIANVLRHSGSDTATIRLAGEGRDVVLEIEDYGRGMADAGARGVGIAGMRERLQHLGGRLEIESDSSGTIVRAVLPLWEGRK